MRGKVRAVTGVFLLSGIIPAGAGKRELLQSVQSLFGDHPRGCGEKASSLPSLAQQQGSSPRVRGKERGGVAEDGGEGIIPAGAGKSSVRSRSAAGGRGSSPRVRGKVTFGLLVSVRTGIIPAGAGKSRSLSRGF